MNLPRGALALVGLSVIVLIDGMRDRSKRV